MEQSAENTNFWSNELGSLLQNIYTSHGINIRIKDIREKFDSMPADNLEATVRSVSEEVGFEIKSSSSLSAVQEGDVLIFFDVTRVGVLKLITEHEVEINYSDGDYIQSNLDDFLNATSIKLFRLKKIIEDIDGPTERLRNLNVLRTLGASNFIVIAIASILSNVLGLASSLFIMVVYDRIIPNQSNESLYALAAGVLIAIVFDIILKANRSKILELAANKADRRIVEEIFEQYVESAKDNRKKSIGALSTVVKDYEVYRDFVSSATILALIDLPFVFIFIYVIYLIGDSLALVPLVAIPVLFLGVLIVQPFLLKISKKLSKSVQDRQTNLVEILNGLDHIRTTAAYSMMRYRFRNRSIIYSDYSNRSKSLSGFTAGLISTTQQVSQIVIVVFGFHLLADQVITMGAIIATVILSGRALGPLSKISQTLSRANQALTSYKNLKVFFEEKRVSRSSNSVDLLSRSKAIFNANNITLRLNEESKPIFQDFNLSVEVGQTVGIIGRSGAGKTTLIRLLAGLLQPERGNTQYLDNDIRSYSRADFQDLVSFIFQESWLFSGTLRENIAFGRSDITDEMVKRALYVSGIDLGSSDNVDILDMLINERGTNLSGGQRQAVCIARAVVKRPDVFIFDEPTSAMDQKSENEFMARFKKEFPESTSIFVTHKPAIIGNCSRIIVMDKGRISWDGSREEYIELTSSRSKRTKQ